MSEKIVITVEQDEALKACLETFKHSKERIMNTHAHDSEWGNDFKTLNSFDASQMARILYEPNSYEVEQPKFEDGQWVTRLKDSANEKPQFRKGKTFKVKYSHGNTVVSDSSYHNRYSIRHATPEEIMFAELGRELNEVKFNDTFMLKNGDVYRLITKGQEIEIGKMLSAGDFVGFYPSDSFIKFP